MNFGNTSEYGQGYVVDFQDIFNPQNNNIGSGRNLRVLQFTDNVTYLRGDHTFKTGVEIRNPWVRRWSFTGTLPLLEFGTGNLTGFSQASHFQGSTAAEYVSARVLANTLTGAYDTVTQVFNIGDPESRAIVPRAPEVREYDNWETNLYLQDTWRLKPNLTLSLGLRYEYNTAPKESNNLGLLPVGGSAALYGISGDGNVFMPGTLTGSNPVLDFPADGTLYNSDKNNFAPVLGFAWDPFKKGKMSIRGGYRMSYFQGSFNTIDGTLDDNEGLILTTVQSYSAGYLRDGFPTPPTPTVNIPALQDIQLVSTVDIRAFDEHLKTPYMHDFSFGVQYEVFKGTSLEVRYVGNRGKKLYRGYDVNEVNIFAVDPNTGQSILDAFLIAQNNLAVSRDINGVDNFSYNPALPGSQPNPLFDVLFATRPTEFALAAYITRLDEGTVGDFADYVSRVRLIGGVRGAPFFDAVARGDLPINFIRANPSVRGAQLFANGSESSYDSLQVELTRRLSGGLRFQASYTFAKALSDFIGSTGDTNSFLTIRDTRREYAQFNNTHQFLANSIYQLPFGRGRKFLRGAKGIAGALISGWQIGGIVKFSSGDPLSLISDRGTYNRNDRSASNTVDVVGGLDRGQLADIMGVTRGPNGVTYINPNFAPGSSADASQVIFLNPQPGTIGSLGLSTIYGPSFFNFDFSTIKKTRINERMNVEFRAEIFNALNTVNFDNPITDINSPNFGRITNIVGRPRLMQFALRLNF
ncbi:MAG: TonB-dependent receptor [Pyrinomonadaceae bacterium]